MNKPLSKKIGEMNKVELMRELGRWMKRVEDQQKTIIKQREKLEVFDEATAQLNQLVDAMMIEFLKKFGAEVGDGVYELTIPAPRVKKVPTETVSTSVSEDKTTYTLRLDPIRKEQKIPAQKKAETSEEE